MILHNAAKNIYTRPNQLQCGQTYRLRLLCSCASSSWSLFRRATILFSFSMKASTTTETAAALMSSMPSPESYCSDTRKHKRELYKVIQARKWRHVRAQWCVRNAFEIQLSCGISPRHAPFWSYPLGLLRVNRVQRGKPYKQRLAATVRRYLFCVPHWSLSNVLTHFFT